MEETSDFKYSINSVCHAVKLIEVMAGNNCEMSFSDIRNAMDLPKGTVFRLLGTLKDLGYVEQIRSSRSYVFSLKFFELSVQIANSIGEKTGLHAISPILKSLSAEFNEMISFVILDRREILFIYCINSNRPLKLDIQIGSRQPAYCTAHGRILLAYLPPAELDTYFSNLEITRYTEHTVIDEKALRGILNDTQAKGFSLVRDEFIPGVSCLAVPVSDIQGKVRAAVGFNIPTARLTDSLQETFLRALRQKVAHLHVSQQSMDQILHISS